jgi:hypothetical protein
MSEMAVIESETSRRPSSRKASYIPTLGDLTSLGWQMIAWYLVISAVLLAIILRFAPHFSYSLDDAYIHLALAQNILQGHYGINRGVTVSPSSSVVWPFLLAPLSESAVREWVPLAWNVLFSLATCAVLGRFLTPRLQKNGMGRLESLLFAPVLIIAANLIGLTFTGMEHCLQILLISFCAIAVISAYDGVPIPAYCLAAAALAPAVRYEDLAFTTAVCATVWLQKRRLAAIVTFVVSLLPMVVLGLFLRAHGLSFFPNSVLAKGKVAGAGSGQAGAHPALANLLNTLRENTLSYILPRQPSRYAILALFLGVAFLLWKNRSARPVILLVPALGAALAMMLIGPYGWFYRYDVCERLFLFLIALCLVLKVLPGRRWLVWACALLAAVGYVPALTRTDFSSIQIARQQYEMHRFTSEFARENVALIDLGWVSFDSRGRFYVLDLVGLGSDDTLRVADKDKTPEWLDAITRKHDIGLVMIYRNWFGAVPSNWIPLGVLEEKALRYGGSEASSIVYFYATSQSSADRLAPEVRRFSASLPPNVWFKPAVR